jgi:transcriptional regulator with XRE-family HTH domain
MPTRADLGKRIREERLRQSLTLKDVEGRSGVSATHVSQIERGITWPTVNALDKIARALEKNTSFFLEEVELPDVSTMAGAGRKVVWNEKPRVVLESLTSGIPGGRMHFYKLVADPSTSGAPAGTAEHCHEGEECGWVITGEIEVDVDGSTYRLKAGDAIHFNGAKPHSVRNVGKSVSESIWASMGLGI